MDNFNEYCIKYLGYPFSFDFIVKLHKYFNIYYRNVFCKIAPIWLKYIHNEYRNENKTIYEVEDIDYVKFKSLYTGDVINLKYIFDKFRDFVFANLSNKLVEEFSSNSYDRLKLDDKLNILICPCLLGVYRSDSYRSFLIFPFYCKINSNLKVSNELIELFKLISTNPKTKDSNFDVMKPNEIKVGYLDNLQRIISKSQNIKILISVHFNTNTDFTLFELDFNNSLNYLNST
ncbi:hypothetical protein MACK_003634 [Theileria orientalis]|uniref:Uncharacterized protein n=1 Tax=Theileria orientalis TaxID=68886 RepID=A0A976XJF0_THEOR|nr:hypothetical protein MACK_003634 [Theileria orientalis]